MWVGSIATKALGDGDKATIDALVTTIAESVRYNPDPGKPVDGWDEGVNLRRQQALNCLWRVTGGDTRLLPAIEATAKANMDMTRYYGPPYRPVHNHGMMANLALLETGTLHSRSEWVNRAVSRMVNDSSAVWTPRGLSTEQSAMYGMLNVKIWRRAADLLEVQPQAAVRAAAARIKVDLNGRVSTASAWITDVHGHLVAYGDGNTQAGVIAPQRASSFRDDVGGVAAGRWSWTDPSTTYYLLRYGAPRRAHGHQDRGALVWSTLGTDVLVDPGTFHNDPNRPLAVWSLGAVGHNVQVVPKKALLPTAAVTLSKTTTSGRAHGYSMVDSLYGQRHVRSWLIDEGRHQVVLTDHTPSAATTLLHLDPAWTLRSTTRGGRTVVLTHPSGRTLTVVGSSALTAYRATGSPLAGWVFPAYLTKVPAVQLMMQPPAGRSSVTLTVR
jgi:hypothetical protein